MNSRNQLKLAALASDQWGLFTARQAGRVGVSAVSLSRYLSSGVVERIRHGVYKLAGAPASRLEDVYAAWLSLRPAMLAHERLADLEGDFVVRGATACWVRDVGDLQPEPFGFTSQRPVQRRGQSVRIVSSTINRDDIEIVEGLPVSSAARSIEELARDGVDFEQLIDVVSEFGVTRFDPARLETALVRAGKSYGLRRSDVRREISSLVAVEIALLEGARASWGFGAVAQGEAQSQSQSTAQAA